jgi:hypothetical protein
MKTCTLLPRIISALRAWDLIWINGMQDDARPADEGFERSGHFSPRMVARLRSSALAATSSELPDMAIAATPGRQADRADLRLLIRMSRYLLYRRDKRIWGKSYKGTNIELKQMPYMNVSIKPNRKL